MSEIYAENELMNGTFFKMLIAVAVIVGIAFGYILLRIIVNGPFYRKRTRIDGKVVIITGCNSGIGKETAIDLARRGGRIYMACRDFSRAEAAREEIIAKSENPNVFNLVPMDLASLKSIQRFVDRFLQEEDRLDILINNAGLSVITRKTTEDGFEMSFGVMHLGHFFLTNLLLDTLKASAPSRIINVSSHFQWLHYLRKHDIHWEKSAYSGLLAYSQGKVANILFTKELAKRLKGTGVTANSLGPGIVKTNIVREFPSAYNALKFILRPLFVLPYLNLFSKTAEAGAQTTIRLAVDPELETVSGSYYVDCYIKFLMAPWAQNPETAEWLWDYSVKATGLDKILNNYSRTEIDKYKTNNNNYL